MNEFKETMLQMMQDLKTDIQKLKCVHPENESEFSVLVFKIDAMIKAFSQMDISPDGEIELLNKRLDIAEKVVSRCLYDIAVLKNKVG